MSIPAELKYTREHEWIRFDGNDAVVGITDYAQEALGGVVFVELPSIGSRVEQGAAFGVVESNKAVSDLFAPVTGEVVAVNEGLGDRPELVNESPYEDGWMLRIKVDDSSRMDALLDATAYAAHVESEHGT